MSQNENYVQKKSLQHYNIYINYVTNYLHLNVNIFTTQIFQTLNPNTHIPCHLQAVSLR